MGYAIPAPSDATEAEAWERGVQARREQLFRDSTQRLLVTQDLVLLPLAD